MSLNVEERTAVVEFRLEKAQRAYGLLFDAVFVEPNDETIEAIEESRRGEYAGIVNLTSMEAFKQSMGL